MKYQETFEFAQPYKKDYVDSIELLIEKKQKEAESARAEFISGIFENQEKYREDFKKMLGWPLVGYDGEKLPAVSLCEELSDEETHIVYRMQFEMLGGLKVTGLFFKAKGEGKKPLVIAQHGGAGTPEIISDFFEYKACYHHMTERLMVRDVHVFAPQLLLWNKERYGIEYERREIDARLKRLGSSITAIEVFALQMILNYFETKEYVKNFGMVGLSYGGFYTLFTAAVDERIKSAISCSFFNKRDKIPWPDWVWKNSGFMFDDAEIACLVYPRTLCIELGKKDEYFAYEDGEEAFKKLTEYCKNVGTKWVSLHPFDGIHEFCEDDAPIEKLVNELKGF